MLVFDVPAKGNTFVLRESLLILYGEQGRESPLFPQNGYLRERRACAFSFSPSSAL